MRIHGDENKNPNDLLQPRFFIPSLTIISICMIISNMKNVYVREQGSVISLHELRSFQYMDICTKLHNVFFSLLNVTSGFMNEMLF